MKRTIVLACGLLSTPSGFGALPTACDPAHADGRHVGGYEVLASANRNLNCRYVRIDRRVELYTGYTGITGVNFGRVVPRTLVYQVFSPIPRALVPLEGDFKGPLDLSPGSASDELTGGQDGAVVLHQVSAPTVEVGSTSLTAPINAVAGFGYLHLIYAGVVPADRRSSRQGR